MVEMASCRIGANVPGAAGVSSRRTNPKEESELRTPSPELMVDLMLGTLHLVPTGPGWPVFVFSSFLFFLINRILYSWYMIYNMCIACSNGIFWKGYKVTLCSRSPSFFCLTYQTVNHGLLLNSTIS